MCLCCGPPALFLSTGELVSLSIRDLDVGQNIRQMEMILSSCWKLDIGYWILPSTPKISNSSHAACTFR